MPELGHEAASRIAYDHSAAMFAARVGTEVSSRFETSLDRALIGAFVETVAAQGSGPVIDIGCGTGRVAAFVADRGLDVSGVDIAAKMVAEARSAHPHIRFDVGTLTDLPVAAGSTLGALYWYSIITTPLSELSAVWRELDRVLMPNGHVLIAFQCGDNDIDERRAAYGSTADLALRRHRVEDVAASLATAGFDVRADIRREPELDHETTSQAFLFVRRHDDG